MRRLCKLLILLVWATAMIAQVQELHAIPSTDKVSVSRFSDDTSLLLFGTKKGISIWQLSPKASLLRERTRPAVNVSAAELSHHGQWLALGHEDGTLEIEETRTGTPKAQRKLGSTAVDVITFSADDSQIALAFHDGTVVVVRTDLEHTTPMRGPELGQIEDLRFSNDGSRLAIAGDDANIYIDLASSGELVKQIEELDLPAYSLAFSPDGESLYAAGAGSPVVFRTRDWTLAGHLGVQQQPVNTLRVSADGKSIALRLADASSARLPAPLLVLPTKGNVDQKLLEDIAKPGTTLQFDPGGRLVFTRWSDNVLHVYAWKP